MRENGISELIRILFAVSSDDSIIMPSISRASLPLQYCPQTMELVDAPENPSPHIMSTNGRTQSGDSESNVLLPPLRAYI
jgi:hypothetical protein